jgi:hypothetical protein
MKKTIKAVVMAMPCIRKDWLSSLKARYQEKNLIKILAKVTFEELKLIVGFCRISRPTKIESRIYSLFATSASTVLYKYFK